MRNSPPRAAEAQGHGGFFFSIVVVLAIAIAGCGKKGAPLAPFVRIPAQVDKIGATRMGADVFITVTIPAVNVDRSIPIDIGRVDIYGYTGASAPPLARFAELGDVVASIPVIAPPRIDPDDPAPPPRPRPTATHAVPGLAATVRDELTMDKLVQGRQVVDPRRAPPLAADAPLPGPVVMRRFYAAIPFSTNGVPGPPSSIAEFPLIDAPDRPGALAATYTESGVRLTWEHSGGLLGFVVDRAIGAEPLPFDVLVPVTAPPPDGSVPPGPTTFAVYREIGGDPLASPVPIAPATAWGILPPAAVATAPGGGLSAVDADLQLGRLRCYTVRAARGGVLGPASDPLCFTPQDVFPPTAPAGLAAIPSAEGISLIWDPNNEADLGGYLVLRRTAGDATLRLLTEVPTPDARFLDTDVTPGTRYRYSVIAVDRQLPLPNLSFESTSIEETAR